MKESDFHPDYDRYLLGTPEKVDWANDEACKPSVEKVVIIVRMFINWFFGRKQKI